MSKPVRAWAGFEGGRIVTQGVYDEHVYVGEKPCKFLQVFTKKADAARRFEDVREIEIRIVERKPGLPSTEVEQKP